MSSEAVTTAVDLGREAMDKLEALAMTLGTTVEKMFPLLVTEQQTYGKLMVISSVVLLVISVGLVPVIRKLFTLSTKCRDERDSETVPAMDVKPGDVIDVPHNGRRKVTRVKRESSHISVYWTDPRYGNQENGYALLRTENVVRRLNDFAKGGRISAAKPNLSNGPKKPKPKPKPYPRVVLAKDLRGMASDHAEKLVSMLAPQMVPPPRQTVASEHQHEIF